MRLSETSAFPLLQLEIYCVNKVEFLMKPKGQMFPNLVATSFREHYEAYDVYFLG